MKLDKIKEYVGGCKTAKQVKEFLDKNNIEYTENDKVLENNYYENVAKTKILDINLNEFIRIYYDKTCKGFIVKEYTKVEYKDNGKKKIIPTCYGFTMEMNDYDIITNHNTQVEF